MPVQYKFQCCKHHYISRTNVSNLFQCPYCGSTNPVLEEVDKDEQVITVVKYPQFAPASTCTPKGFSGDARKDTRPWGSYEVLLDEENVKVKKIVVKPFERLSLQLHRGRDEKWVIVQGLGLMHHNGEEYTVKEGHVVEILKYQTHRIENVSEQPLVFIEVQTGDCQEDDIIRIEDSYGRE